MLDVCASRLSFERNTSELKRKLCYFFQTVYGEILPLQSNSDVYGLKRFIKSRFLANPDIAKEYRHATIAECYRPGEFVGI